MIGEEQQNHKNDALKKKRAAWVEERQRLVMKDYPAFARAAMSDLRIAMQDRRYSSADAQRPLLLWCNLGRDAGYPLDSVRDAASEFCLSWCEDPHAAMRLFRESGQLAYIVRKPLLAGRERMRAEFGLQGEDWSVLCSNKEHERRRKAAKRAKVAQGTADEPTEELSTVGHQGRIRAQREVRNVTRADKRRRADAAAAGKPWTQAGTSRATWYRWTDEQREKALEAARPARRKKVHAFWR